MGNLALLKERATEEFERVKNLRKNNDRDYLILQEVLLIQPSNVSREHPIELSHLGTLFILDAEKQGRFYQSTFTTFITLCCERLDASLQSHGRGDFKTQFQGYCTWEMWNSVVQEGGVDVFIDWLAKTLSEAENLNYFGRINKHFQKRKTKSSHSNPSTPRYESDYLSRGSVQTIHSVLNIKKAYGVGDRAFFTLLQQVAEDMEIMTVQERELDDVVPMAVFKYFARDFIAAFIKLMFDLGFETKEELESRKNLKLRKHFAQITSGPPRRNSQML